MERLYSSLMQYIEGGRIPYLDRYISEYKAYLEMIKEERYKYLTEGEKLTIDREIINILYDL